ncbi:thioredoxin family protein [Thalassoroseus pseudoceratinae]|uniref:thioredoxin family protein n=1 Tax=Thalassoroseus pseudoceratinae TaxID=2713176 RepID=UPI00142052D5|nr:thioredoxin family protein [Thalassoroseus pseudoceratinae]
MVDLSKEHATGKFWKVDIMQMTAANRYFLVTMAGLALLWSQSCDAAPPQTAQNIKPIVWQTNLKSALAQSEQTKRPMLLKFTASWCGYCHKLKKVAFSDPRIIQQVQSHFVPVLVDADKNPQLMEALEVEGLPTMVVVSSDLEVITKIVGYQTPDQLSTKFQKVIADRVGKIRLTGNPSNRN